MASQDFPNDILSGSADEAAIGLLGCLLIREFDDGGIAAARIVETEAYDQNDPASHAFHGRSERNAALFGPSGRAYVYISYGMHRCFNVSAGDDGFGAGALIRAVEPVRGVEIMRERRFANRSGSRTTVGNRKDVDLTNGPAKLCQAMGIEHGSIVFGTQCPAGRRAYRGVPENRHQQGGRAAAPILHRGQSLRYEKSVEQTQHITCRLKEHTCKLKESQRRLPEGWQGSAASARQLLRKSEMASAAA